MSPVGVIATGLCRFVGQQIELARMEDLSSQLTSRPDLAELRMGLTAMGEAIALGLWPRAWRVGHAYASHMPALPDQRRSHAS